MSEASLVRRRWWKLLLLFLILSLIVFGFLGWYLTTEHFQQTVRRQIVAALADMTGGRVEIGEFHATPFRLRVDVRNLTIHGREASDQAPFLHVDRLQAEMKIISLLEADVRLHSLEAEHPIIHLIVYPDGTTNQPEPKPKSGAPKNRVDQFFAFSVSQIEVRHGELQWREEKIPLDLDGRDASLAVRYSFLRQQYETRLTVNEINTRFRNYPALVWHLETSFVLARDRAEIHSLTAASGRSELRFSGNVRDFRNPEVSGTYKGTLDLAELALFFRERGVRKGTAVVEGNGSWTLRDFKLEGLLQARGVDWSQGSRKLQDGRVSTVFSVDRQHLRLTSLKAAMLGGELAGDVEVTNWQKEAVGSVPLSQERRRVRPGELERGEMRLQLTGFPLSAALGAMSSPKFPLDRLNLGGAVSGNIEMLWVGSIREAEVRTTLDINPSSRRPPGQLEAQGRIKGIYFGSRDELQLDQFHLITSGSEITASGNLSAHSSLRLDFSSHDLEKWTPLLELAFGSHSLPFKVQGSAIFNGNASGQLSALSINGTLEVYDFETTLPGGSHRRPQPVHWDALTALVQYSSSGVSARNGNLIHGMSLIHFDASTALRQGEFQADLPFTLRLDAQKADIAEVSRLMGFSYPVSGTANLTLHLSGTERQPHGEGHIEVRDAATYAIPIPFLRSDLRLSESEVHFNNVDSSVYDAPITGNAAFHLETSAFRANLTARGLDLARLPRSRNRQVAIAGRADLSIHASGTVDQPSLEARVHVSELSFDQERAGNFAIEAHTEGKQLLVSGQSDFEKAELKVNGAIALENAFPADATLTFRQLDVDSLIRAHLGDRVTGHVLLEGSASLRGPLRSPRDWKVQAELASVNAEFEHVQVHNAEPVRFEMAEQSLRIEQFHFAGSGTDFTAHGVVPLNSGDVDVHLDGTINMALLQTLEPKISARGMLSLNLTASGPLSQPVLVGKLDIKDAYINHSELPSGLSELNGAVLFEQNRGRVENLTGKIGGGTVALTGSAVYVNGAVNLDLAARGRQVRLRYPAGVSSTANLNLRLTGTTNFATLSGDVLVTKLAITPEFDFASYLEKGKVSTPAIQNNTLANRVKLDVHATTASELQMQTAIAKLTGAADVRARGTLDRPVVTGRANATEGGEITFNGNKYRVERLEVTFANPTKTEPAIDLQATTRVRDTDVTIILSGPPDNLTSKFRSDPPLPQADIINLLALGHTQEESAALQANGGSALSGTLTNALITEALNTAVTSRVQRLFGVSRIKIDPQGSASTTNVLRGPQVTVEQQIANKLTVTYSTNVSVSSQQSIEVEYSVSRNVSIVALRDQNGVVSFDVKIRQRKR